MAIVYVQATAPNTNDGSSWATATSLPTALTIANAGDEIWLAQGSYSPGNNPTDTFTVNSALQLYGGFIGNEVTRDERDWQANQTILDGNGNNNTVVTTQSTANTVLIDGVIIQDGNSNDDGAGVYNQNNGRLTIQNTIVRDNQAADDGGGIRNDGELLIVNSSVTGNTAVGTSETSGGGGLLNTIGASVTIVNSTFSGNTAPNGGAIRNDGTLTLTNSTLSGNTALEGGGGLVNTVDVDTSGFPPVVTSRAVAEIFHSTITNNEAQNTSGQVTTAGGGVINFGDINVANSIVANNVGNDDIVDIVILTLNGITTSQGNNFIGNGDDVLGFTDGLNNDQVGSAANPLNPLLDALQANGGFTETHAPRSGSPVIDAGNPGTLPVDIADLDGDSDFSEVISVDQRGVPFARILGATVDIGAVEGVVVPAGVTTTLPATGLITTEAQGTVSFTAVLDSQPSAPVTLNFSSDDPTEGIVTPEVTFSTANWNQPQTVLITGVDDTEDDGDVVYIINTSVTSTDSRYSALVPATLAVTNQDNDDPIAEMGGPTPSPTTTFSSQGERLVIGGPDDVSIEISISQSESNQVREIIVFPTDNTGAVDGLTPSDTGYLDAVLSAAQVVFSTLESGEIPDLNAQRTITATAGSILQFAIVDTGSLDSLRRGEGGTIRLTGVSDQAEVVDLQVLSDSSAQVGFTLNQTDDFSQLVINAVVVSDSVPIGAGLQGLISDSELFDLRAQTGVLTATIDVYREAKLDNVVGLFVVENEQGQVRDALGVLLSPGDDGYAQAALAQRIAIDLTGTNGETVRYTTQVLGGQLLSTFLVVDGTVTDLLDTNTANDPAIYFTHTLGNSDGTDHVRLLGDNTLGFEDLPGGGDADFDDVVIKASFV